MITFNGAPFSGDGRRKRYPVGVLGVPTELGNRSNRGSGQSLGPRGIRLSYSAPLVEGLVDLGDVHAGTLDDLQETLAAETDAALTHEVDRLIVLGGDDSISAAVVNAVRGTGRVNVLHLDAHGDRAEGEFDHSTWLRHAHNKNVRVVQRYVRAPGDVALVEEFWDNTPLVVVLDVDAFDPSVAPGVAVPEPLGPTALDVYRTLTEQNWLDATALVVTEVSPPLDHNDITQRLAFRICHKFAALEEPCLWQTGACKDNRLYRRQQDGRGN